MMVRVLAAAVVGVALAEFVRSQAEDKVKSIPLIGESKFKEFDRGGRIYLGTAAVGGLAGVGLVALMGK
jgi:hypothetical protein